MIFSRTLVFIAFSIISTALSLPSTLQQNSSDTSTFDQTCAQSSFTVASDDNGLWPYRKYRSTNVTSPTMKIERSGESVSDGLIFLGLENSGLLGYPGVGQPRVEIFTDDGDLVWAGSGQNASNFRKQTLNGKPVIHYFVGSGSAAAGGGAAHGCGRIEILDENYETLHNVCPKLDINYLPGQSCDCPLDVHESYITENNTMVCTVYNITQTDLSSVGGPRDGWVYDSLAVEIDIETNEALWIWSALHSVPISSSHNVINSTGVNSSQPYDWFHMNSIFPFRDGFFVNSRETWSSYYVNRNGTVEWELNGLTGGSFGSLPEQAHFSWQHHAQLFETNNSDQVLYTNFADNNQSPATHNASVGLSLLLDLPASTTKPPKTQAYLNDSKAAEYAYAEGSVSIQGNGNYLVGYGVKPRITEFGPTGDVRWSADFAYDNLNNTASSYRAFKDQWHATPTTKPALLVGSASENDTLQNCSGGSSIRGYVSWNGATDVDRWAVYAGSGDQSLTRVAEVQRMGFETAFVVPKGAQSVQVAAVQDGEEIRKSEIVSV